MKLNSTLLFACCVALGILTITSCKSKKSVQKGSTEVTVPLVSKEYQSDKEYFRASQSGKSPDLATAKKIALQNAKTELAGHIQSTIKAVTDNYTNQRSVGDKQAYENKFEEMARSVVHQTLNDVRIIGEKTFREQDGKLTYYVAIEMSKEPIIKDLADRISKDQQLQLDFDKKQFLKVFDEEMDKFSKEN